MGNSVDLQG